MNTPSEGAVAPPSSGRAAAPAWLRFGGWVLTAIGLLYLVVVHHGLGPRLAGDRWWLPTNFLSEVSPELLPPAMALFGGIALAITAAVLLATRSAVARFLAVTQLVGVALVVTFGVGSTLAWTFFHWRWSMSLALLAVVVAAVLTAPVLAEAWRRLPVWARVATYLPVFGAVVAYERNVTGTDPDLSFALSPWPVVQILGLELVGSFVSAVWLGTAGGLAILGREKLGRALAIPGALLCAVAFPLVFVGAGSRLGLLPFAAGPAIFLLTTVGGALALGLACLGAGGGRDALAARSRRLALGGLLAALPLMVGQGLTLLDYTATREGRAQEVIAALKLWIEREGVYPDTLDDLVAAGDLAKAPTTRIGFAGLGDRDFSYQSFGTNYVLEFSAPRWVQCAYNPPWADALSEEELAELEEEGEEDLGGAWSCPRRPPELW